MRSPFILGFCLFASALVVESRVAQAGETPDDPNLDILRSAKLPTDGPGLLKVLESWTGNDQDCVHLDDFIQQLGDASFAKRNEASRRIVALRHAALAQLECAKSSKDAEIQARAKDCLTKVHAQYRYGIPMTVVRVLGRLKPEGTAEALVRYLPYIAEEEVQEEIWFTVYGLVKERSGALLPAIEKTLQNPLPARRALAGCVVGRLGNKQQQAAVAKLLEDQDAQVRLRAAQGLLAGKNLAGMPTLIKLLEEPGVEISWSAEELLHYLAGDDAPEQKVGAASAEERQASRQAWGIWWRSRAAKFSLAEVEKHHRRPGLLLVNSGPDIGDPPGTESTIWTCGCDGKTRWELQTPPFSSAQLLPGNRLLIVASNPPDFPVSERNLHGKVLWNPRPKVIYPEIDGVMQAPPYEIYGNQIMSVRRFLSGNTYLSLGAIGAVEIDRGGGQLSSVQILHRKDIISTSLRMLSNGRLLAIWQCPAEIGELDPISGKTLRTTSVPDSEKAHVEVIDVLPNGNYVILGRNGLFSEEIDYHGKIVRVTPNYKYSGVRLRNGNFLGGGVVDQVSRIFEASSDGRLLWEIFVRGQPKDFLGLIRLGFDWPRLPELDLASVASRIKLLQSEDRFLQGIAAKDLATLGPKAASAIPALTVFLEPSHGDIKANVALKILTALGPAAYPAIMKAARHKNWKVRTTALRVLGRFTDKTDVLVLLWLDGLKDKDADVREGALDGLMGNLSNRISQKELVTETERKQTIRRIAEAMSDPDIAERACYHLGALGPDAIPYLVPILKSKNVSLRSVAAFSLAYIGPNAAICVPELLEAFHAKDLPENEAGLALRLSIIHTLGCIGPKAKSTIPLLVQILKEGLPQNLWVKNWGFAPGPRIFKAWLGCPTG